MAIETVTAWVMLLSLAVYALTGGADFGAGVWDLLAWGRRRRELRELLARAIAPIWEANHVWLILVVVLLFTCFPRAFAAMMTALHVPVTLALIGIVLRGSAFVFRAYSAPGDERTRRMWGGAFSGASVITPVLLGVTLGAAASGALRWENAVYVGGFFRPWLRAFPWSVGVFALTIFAFLAAVYMCVEAREPGLRRAFQARALASGLAVGVMAAITWMIAERGGARELSEGLAKDWWAIPLQLATGAVAIGALVSLWFERYRLARACAAAQVVLIVIGFGAAIYPYLIVPDVLLMDAAAPPRTHRLVLVALAVGAIVLLPSLAYLFRVFKSGREPDR
jgi:cytochrome bd ubiquinol oxidase subunit II